MPMRKGARETRKLARSQLRKDILVFLSTRERMDALRMSLLARMQLKEVILLFCSMHTNTAARGMSTTVKWRRLGVTV